MFKKLTELVKDESGATAIEYGLIAAGTGLALAGIMPFVKSSLETTFGDINNALKP